MREDRWESKAGKGSVGGKRRDKRRYEGVSGKDYVKQERKGGEKTG